MAPKEPGIPARLLYRRHIAEGLAIFRIELDRDFHFQAGQYATLWLTHQGRTTPRPYSIASPPSQTRVLEFYINLVEAGRLTQTLWSDEVLEALQMREPGTEIGLTGPKGHFVLDPADSRDLLFIASGTGLAPFMSMIRGLNEADLAGPRPPRARNLLVIHGVSYPENLGYREELQQLSAETRGDPGRGLTVAYLPTISRPRTAPGWTGLTGRAESLVDLQREDGPDTPEAQKAVRGLLRAELKPERCAVYICGHPGTVDGVVRNLAPLGFLPDRDLKREKYYP